MESGKGRRGQGKREWLGRGGEGGGGTEKWEGREEPDREIKEEK